MGTAVLIQDTLEEACVFLQCIKPIDRDDINCKGSGDIQDVEKQIHNSEVIQQIQAGDKCVLLINSVCCACCVFGLKQATLRKTM